MDSDMLEKRKEKMNKTPQTNQKDSAPSEEADKLIAGLHKDLGHAWKNDKSAKVVHKPAAPQPAKARQITELWPDDLKHSLARVVSIIAKHAGARDGAAWSELWQHFENTAAELERVKQQFAEYKIGAEADFKYYEREHLKVLREIGEQRDELLAALKKVQGQVRNGYTLDADRTVTVAIAKAERGGRRE